MLGITKKEIIIVETGEIFSDIVLVIKGKIAAPSYDCPENIEKVCFEKKFFLRFLSDGKHHLFGGGVETTPYRILSIPLDKTIATKAKDYLLYCLKKGDIPGLSPSLIEELRKKLKKGRININV